MPALRPRVARRRCLPPRLAALEPRDSGFDLAVHRTLEHGGALLAVRYSVDLGPVEGIGALLRF